MTTADFENLRAAFIVGIQLGLPESKNGVVL